MNFFEKFNIKKFNEIERKILSIYLDSNMILAIEEFGHIPMSKKRVFFTRPLFRTLRNKSISRGMESIQTQFQSREKQSLISEFCNNKEGFLLCSTHHTFEDAPYICKILKRLKFVDLKSSYPIFIREPTTGIKFGMAIPILRENEVKYVKMILEQKNELPDKFSRIIVSLSNKLLTCAKCLILEGKIVVLFPEGIRRDTATKENIQISVNVRTILKHFTDLNCYAIKLMDKSEIFGVGKSYKPGIRTFEVLKLVVNDSLEERLNAHFNSSLD